MSILGAAVVVPTVTVQVMTGEELAHRSAPQTYCINQHLALYFT